VHGSEETGANRRQRDTRFTLRTAVYAWSRVGVLRFNSPLAYNMVVEEVAQRPPRNRAPGPLDPGLRPFGRGSERR